MAPPQDPDRHLALVGDIGGSTARFAIAAMSGADIKLQHATALRCADYQGFEQAAAAFLARLPGARPAAAAVAIAGPVTGDRVALTNHPWSFSVEAARRQLKLDWLPVGV